MALSKFFSIKNRIALSLIIIVVRFYQSSLELKIKTVLRNSLVLKSIKNSIKNSIALSKFL